MPIVNYHAVDGLLLGETNVSGARRDCLTDAVDWVVHTVKTNLDADAKKRGYSKE